MDIPKPETKPWTLKKRGRWWTIYFRGAHHRVSIHEFYDGFDAWTALWQSHDEWTRK